MRLPPGKIPVDILKEVVFKNLGIERREVVLGPSAGIDGAVIDIGNNSLIVSADPITGATERIGWLAVNINANDVATFGVEPAFLLSCILLPENADRETVETISVQIGEAAKKLGMAVVGGHCEVTPGLTSPIAVGCTIGVTEKGNYVTAGDAKQGDKLILTKSAGIEGTAILASDRKQQLRKTLDARTLRIAEEYYSQISVVKDALIAFKTGGVHAMHDPTEGGVVGGVHEMAEASNLGARIYEEKILVQPETIKICQFFRIDPLQLISSGALLIATESRSAGKVVDKLRSEHIHASIIGEFRKNPEERNIIKKSGKTLALPTQVSDHLWVALRK
jgi:hydrogenase maturation factor